jgi:hypothetical protein
MKNVPGVASLGDDDRNNNNKVGPGPVLDSALFFAPLDTVQ